MSSTETSTNGTTNGTQPNPAHRHLIDCQRKLAEMVYDGRCMRCSKIKQVIHLRRKTIKNGASEFEESAAESIARRLIETCELTKGEVRDPEYAEVMIVARHQAAATEQKRRRRRGRTIQETFARGVEI